MFWNNFFKKKERKIKAEWSKEFKNIWMDANLAVMNSDDDSDSACVKKFGELLVKKCMDLSFDEKAKDRISSHFGVEK